MTLVMTLLRKNNLSRQGNQVRVSCSCNTQALIFNLKLTQMLYWRSESLLIHFIRHAQADQINRAQEVFAKEIQSQSQIDLSSPNRLKRPQRNIAWMKRRSESKVVRGASSAPTSTMPSFYHQVKMKMLLRLLTLKMEVTLWVEIELTVRRYNNTWNLQLRWRESNIRISLGLVHLAGNQTIR